MKKYKRWVSGAVCIGVIACIVFLYVMGQKWPVRYKSQMDHFFGKGNWECVSEERKISTMYEKHDGYRSRRHRYGHIYNDRTVAGTYRNWDIEFTDREGQLQLARISDHAKNINNSKYWYFNPKRYSAKQALTLELMNIAFEMAGDRLRQEIVESVLTEEESACMRVTISYEGGNPMPKFYDKLAKQPWFQANQVTAGDFLAFDEHEFYIDIFVYDYRLEKLTPEQQQNVMDSFEVIQDKLMEAYGENASFQMFYDTEHKIEVKKGEAVTK